MNAISKGHVVNFAWLWTKARKLQTEIYPTVEIKHHLEKNVFELALMNQVMMINVDDTSLLKGLMLIRVHCLLLFMAKRLTNMFHLVKALHIIHGFLNQEQDWRNVNAPCK